MTNKNNKLYFAILIVDKDGFIPEMIPPGAYEIENLNKIEKNTFEERHFTEVEHPFKNKPHFSTLGSIIEIFRQEPLVSLSPEDSIRDILGFSADKIYGEYNLARTPVDVLSFDNTFLECENDQRLVFKSKRSGTILNITMHVSPGSKNVEKFKGGVQWYLANTKGFTS